MKKKIMYFYFPTYVRSGCNDDWYFITRYTERDEKKKKMRKEKWRRRTPALRALTGSQGVKRAPVAVYISI